MTHNDIAKIIVGVALDIHRKLGPGFWNPFIRM